MDDDMFWVMLSDYPDSNDDIVEPPGCQINKFSEAEFYRERARRTEQLHRDQREKLLNSFAEERRSHRLEFFRMIDHDYLADVREGINPLRTMDLCPSVSMILYGSNKSDNGSMENVQEVEDGLNNAIARLLISGEDRARLTIQDILVQYRAEQEFIRERQLAKLKDLRKYQIQVMNNLRSHIKDDITVSKQAQHSTPITESANNTRNMQSAQTPSVNVPTTNVVGNNEYSSSRQTTSAVPPSVNVGNNNFSPTVPSSTATPNTSNPPIACPMSHPPPEIAEFWNAFVSHLQPGTSQQQAAALLSIIATMANNQQPLNGSNNQPPSKGANNQPPFSSANNQQAFSSANNQQPFNGVNNQQAFSGANNQQAFSGTSNLQPFSGANHK
ncbi:251_t:CDS:2 [Cetraspora pellucida]|uniref:251_t:CDS:1 n=1 Tax=Cetraspora pellucida TaxID=1433469 RepID=A0A9N8WBS5_9GLOM|nr:251_t:CDS:2 [Cetraspora pellucida]